MIYWIECTCGLAGPDNFATEARAWLESARHIADHVRAGDIKEDRTCKFTAEVHSDTEVGVG